MTTRFDKEDRVHIASLATAEDLLAFIDGLQLPVIGKNYKLLISEIATRLDVPADSIALVMIRPEKDGFKIYRWADYVAERVAVLREQPGRRWNNTVKADTFVLRADEIHAFFAFNNRHFNRTAVLEKGALRIEAGQASAAWSEDTVYDLSDWTYTVNLGDVARGLTELRPQDTPGRIALLGEADPDYRALFGAGLKADPEVLDGLAIKTRHPYLLFRVQVPDGQLRYLFYSAAEGRLLNVSFGDSKEANRLLSQFKEAQQRLNHPLIEQDRELFEQLRVIAKIPG